MEEIGKLQRFETSEMLTRVLHALEELRRQATPELGAGIDEVLHDVGRVAASLSDRYGAHLTEREGYHAGHVWRLEGEDSTPRGYKTTLTTRHGALVLCVWPHAKSGWSYGGLACWSGVPVLAGGGGEEGGFAFGIAVSCAVEHAESWLAKQQ